MLHLHSSKAGLVGRLAVRGRVPTVFSPHGWSFLVPGPTSKASLRWERVASRWTDVIVAVGEGERDIARQNGIRGRVDVVRNGAMLDLGLPAGRSEARAELGLNDNPLVVCVGRLCEQKGQLPLVRRWPAVRECVPGATLALIGDGPDTEAILRHAGEGVLVLGHRDDAQRWMLAADVCAQPSRWEGLPYSVLEATSLGKPVLAFDIPTIREIVGDDRLLISAVSDYQALAERLVEVLNDRDTWEGRASSVAARTRQVFSAAAQADSLLDIYEELSKP